MAGFFIPNKVKGILKRKKTEDNHIKIMIKAHTFHIPVMGIAFTIDSPLKVARYGINSVISIGDDILMEKLRKFYCEKYAVSYDEISIETKDHRAERITAYLNLIDLLITKQFEEMFSQSVEGKNELIHHLNLLPESELKLHYLNLLQEKNIKSEDLDALRNILKKGSIDVNIMTKLDKENYFKGEKLPIEYNDAHAALRGFANSNLNSSIVLSAGLNPRLYTYLTQFNDFYPNADGHFRKKVVLKVSDYRSAHIQGQFLAKKGIWVSEFRIESGLNCGGHAFATDGLLLGTILDEFNRNKSELINSLKDSFLKALEAKGRSTNSDQLTFKLSVQGGVGTSQEQDFLLKYYSIDSVGWGTPFLLVPEATTVDEGTLQKLINAQEKDLYRSDISPLGVPFNNLRGNSKDEQKEMNELKGRPGSSCPKNYLALNKEFSDEALCTASRKYQYLKLKELENQNFSTEEFESKYAKIVEKSCICVGLGTSALLVNGLDTKVEGEGVSVCPGPNMAYFSQIATLKEMVDHIYGRVSLNLRKDRPNMFIKELELYIDYLLTKINESISECKIDSIKKLSTFSINLQEGINYYRGLRDQFDLYFKESSETIFIMLNKKNIELKCLRDKIERLLIPLT